MTDMLASRNWLNEFVDIKDIQDEALAEDLSRTGLEVDGLNQDFSGLKKIVVGKTLTVEKHPNADSLHVCQVDVGQKEPLQIVCGAPNVAAGQKVIVALHGARVTGNQKIKKGKLRGQESNGMLCSLQELGFSENVIPKEFANGIMILPEDAPLGQDIKEYLGLEDTVLDLDITPNRADALSMRGVAYELSAIYDRSIDVNTYDDQAFEAGSDLSGEVTVDISDSDLFPHYTAHLVKDVKIQASPIEVQIRLMKEGIRPINNVVDATNYVLLEYGQPLHAFDYDKLQSKTIAPRLAKTGEKLVTLDGVERDLTDDDLVITDGQEPIALAGVMGGLSTEIDDNTTTVLIESAMFNSSHIRRTARRLALRSESSLRNERGLNIATIDEAGAYAAQLMEDWAGGQAVKGRARVSHLDIKDKEVTTNLDYITSLLGMEISFEEVKESFRRLGFPVEGDADEFTVSVPTRRWDISIPANLVEEVARIYGYDKIPSRISPVQPVKIGLNDWQKFERQSHRTMEALGFDQVISYSLTSEKKLDVLQAQAHEAVALDFPMSDERRYMRTNLLTSLLDIAQYNLARKVKDVQIYEIGRVFYNDELEDDLPREESHLAALWTGDVEGDSWQGKAQAVDFYDMKGAVEALLASYNLAGQIRYQQRTDLPDTHPGRTALVQVENQGKWLTIGYLAQLHPQITKDYDLNSQSFVAEFNLQAIYDLPEHQVIQEPLAKYPSISRDIAMVVAEEVSHAEIVATIQKAANSYLVNVKLFDIYRGDHIQDGQKSVAYQLTYLNPEATLVDEEVNEDFAKVKAALANELQAKIRD